MSSVDQIKKINEMSQYLKKHGFAADSQEAVSQAKDLYKGTFDAVQPSKKIAEQKQEERQKEDSMQQANSDVSKIERNLEMFKASALQQIESLRAEVSTVVSKMNEIIKAINELEKLKDSVTSIDDGDEKQQRLAPKVVKKPVSDKPVNHPRSGGMQPGDIDLTKTFYFGKK